MPRDPELEKLNEMFPSIERDVIMMILEETHRDFNNAADILICMASEDDNSSQQNNDTDNIEKEEILNKGEEYIDFSDQLELLSFKSDQEKREDFSSQGNSSNWSQVAKNQCSPKPLKRMAIQTNKEHFHGVVSQDFKDIGNPDVLVEFNYGRNILIVMRGPPGSGKSTLAQKYVNILKTGKIYSTDDFFMRKEKYVFNPQELPDAHGYNQAVVKNALQAGERVVIVDNTNTMSWEMRPYLAMGALYRYKMFIQEPTHEWAFNAKTLAKNNIHQVPKDKIELMIARYEKGLTVEILAERYNIALPQFDQPIDSTKREGIGVETNDILENNENIDNSAKSNEGAKEDEKNEKEESVERPVSAEIFESDNESDDNVIVNDIDNVIANDMDDVESDTNSASAQSCYDSDEITGETNLKAETNNISVPVLKSQDEPPRLFELDNYFNPTGSVDTQPTTSQKYDDNSQEFDFPKSWASGAQSTFQPIPYQNNDNTGHELYLPQSWASGDQSTFQPTPNQNDNTSQELYLPQPWTTGAKATFQPTPNQNDNNTGQKLYLPQPWATQATVESSESGATASTPEVESIKKEPKPQRRSRPQQKKQKKRTDITKEVYNEVHQKQQEMWLDKLLTAATSNTAATASISNTAYSPVAGSRPTFISDDVKGVEDDSLSFTLDPMSAVSLQETFGPPLDESVLQMLNTEEILSAVKIPKSLAHQIFKCWQSSLIDYISNREEELVTKLDLKSEEQFPKVVMAPDAAEYYEKVELEKAIAESQRAASLAERRRPILVVKSRSADRITNSTEKDNDIADMYRKKRDELYKQAMHSRSNKVMGAAAFYASEARAQNKLFKEKLEDKQMNMFQAANNYKLNKNQIDLHYLNTGAAIKQLQVFIQEKEYGLSTGNSLTIHVITGRGLNSENGRSKLRPAVIAWLNQKNYRFSDLNSGALTVYLPRNN